MHLAIISGIIHTVTNNSQRKDWQHIVLRYGPQRAMSGHQVEFLNAVMLEVPAYITANPANNSLLKPGMLVSVRARASGRARSVSSTRFVDNMPVVEAIERVSSFTPIFVESARLPPLGTVEGTSVPLAAEGPDGDNPKSNHRNMLNFVILSGYLIRAIPSGKRDAEGNKKITSATLHIQTGKNKDDGAYHVNEAMVRLPEFLYPKVYRILEPGQRFDLRCHYQGVLKSDKDVRYIDNELVADQIMPMWGEKDQMLNELSTRRAPKSEPGVDAPFASSNQQRAAPPVTTEVTKRRPAKVKAAKPAETDAPAAVVAPVAEVTPAPAVDGSAVTDPALS